MSRREALVMAGAATAGLTPMPGAWASAPTRAPTPDPMSLVDPELREPLRQMLASVGSLELSATNLKQARRSGGGESPRPAPAYEERRIPGPVGAPDVRVFVINAAGHEGLRPAILYTHGGGFVMGSAAADIPWLQQTALEHDCVIVSVDYRLAPEMRFPGSLEDNYAALKWLHQSASMLSVDASRIAVMGGSAGGGHAAMLALAARDRGGAALAFQLLICPMLDDRTGSTRHLPPHLGAFVWRPASNRFGWSSLLGVPAGSRIVPSGAVPARVENLTGLPPAFIGVGSIDLFVDEDVDYARRLIDAGVPTQLCVLPGGYHGFDAIAPQASVSKVFRATWNASLAKAFEIKTKT